MTFSARARFDLRGAAVGAIACCCSAAAGAAADTVRPFVGQYEGSKPVALITAKASAKIELRRSAQYIRYTMHSTVKWALLERKFRDCSVIRIEGDGKLRPLEYLHVDESDAKHNVRTRFDWTQNKASTLIGTATEAMVESITWPTWDPMSFQVALIALAPQRAAGDGEKHRVVERGAVKDYQVSFSGRVPLSLHGKSLRVHEIVGRKATGQVALYLLPESSWQPARVVVNDVTVDALAGAAAGGPPASLAPGQVPQCDAGAER